MKRSRIPEFAVLVLLLCATVIWAGYQRDIDEILYQRLQSIDMPADSIDIVMKLPRSLINWEKDGIACETYLDVEYGVDAAAIIHVDQKCFKKKVLFNYSGLRKGE